MKTLIAAAVAAFLCGLVAAPSVASAQSRPWLMKQGVFAPTEDARGTPRSAIDAPCERRKGRRPPDARFDVTGDMGAADRDDGREANVRGPVALLRN